jgi:adenylate cyclase
MMARHYQFGSFVFDGRTKALVRNGTVLNVGQRALALLEALLAANGRTVSKSALIEAAWKTENIEESNLTVQIAALRKSLGQQANGEEWISTVQRSGYRFADITATSLAATFVPQRLAFSSADGRLSIAVLPFVNLTNEPDHEFIADGMTEDLITALSRIKELMVISRSSAFAYKGRNVPLEEVARDLGVCYLLEGSVRVAGDKVRINANLVDGRSGKQIWEERFDGELKDIFAVQDEITRNIAVAIQIKLTYGELARLWEGQTKSLRAWEKMAQGRNLFLEFDPINNLEAQRVLKEALDIDPKYIGAMIQLGLCYWWQARYNPAFEKESSLRACEEEVQRALALDPTIGAAYMLLGGNAFLRDQHDLAMELCEKAITLSPSDSWAMAFLGLVCGYGGKPERAIEVLKTAMQLSPNPPVWYIESFAWANLWAGNQEIAERAAEENSRLDPDDCDCSMLLASVYGIGNREADASRVVSEMRAKFPNFSIKNVILSERYKEVETRDKVLAVLRRAGLPE